MRAQIATALALVWLGFAMGCAPATPAQDEKALTALEARGWRIFDRERCLSSCHLYGILFADKTRTTGSIPDLRQTPHHTRDWYLAYLINPQAILPRSPMPTLVRLPPDDLEALIAFLRRLNRDVPTPAVEPVSVEMISQTPRNLSAYRAGQATYRFYCVGCHGELGNGAGPVGHLLLPEPRNFTDVTWMSKQTDEYLLSVITNGKPDTAMPAFKDLLIAQERAVVLRYAQYFADPVSRERMEQGFVVPEIPLQAVQSAAQTGWIR